MSTGCGCRVRVLRVRARARVRRLLAHLAVGLGGVELLVERGEHGLLVGRPVEDQLARRRKPLRLP